MIVKFDYKNRKFINIEIYDGSIPSTYHSFMCSGYQECYVDINKYVENECFIYYIRAFMKENIHIINKFKREEKLKRILNEKFK